MRIGLLTSYLALSDDLDSGIGQHYRILADALAAQGHRVHLVHPTLAPDAARAALAALAPPWTCDIVPVRTPPWLDRALLRSWPARVFQAQLRAARAASPVMAAAVRRLGLQVFETHATATPALAYLQLPSRAPVVTRLSTTASQLNSASGLSSRIGDWQARLERRAVRASDAVLTHTRRHRDALCALEGYRASDFAIIPHGLPDLARPPARPSADPAPDAPIEILYVGRFENRKGTDVLLDAIPAVAAAHPRTRFTLAGSLADGVLWREFGARHPELAGSRVIATGRVSAERLDALYAACDVLVAPSRYESFGLIYVEAMRHAKPVVGCDAGGIPDVVTEGVTGLLAAPGDAPGLTACLSRLAGDPALRARLGRAGRADFLRRFSAERLAASSAELYQHLVNDAGSRVL